ncbi:hypothetical protein SAMN05421837_101133 [Amycolatopsis pretoriensis]|uniref:Uncharacterized protein n=2 Tax=Amycolatopsis pretoriensis TaxID=218821 RepID=A0A1H5Q1D2_9PSEU|nr:hypothetical protein SAMN05421837_101133 [Amycolatopsis pretoriensis]
MSSGSNTTTPLTTGRRLRPKPAAPATGHDDDQVVRLTLVVVPPETGSETAEQVLATAASADNADGGAHLLASRGGRVPLPA